MSDAQAPSTNRQPLIYGPAPRSDQRALERITNDLRTGGPSLGDEFTLPPSGDIVIAPTPGTSTDPIALPTPTVSGGGQVLYYAIVDTFDGTTQLGTATRVDTSASVSYRNTTGRTLGVGDTVLISEVESEALVIAVYAITGGYTPISFVAPSNIGFPFDGLSVSDGMYTNAFASFAGITDGARFGIVVDGAGSLGFGAGAVVSVHRETAGSPKVVVRNPNTGTSHSLGSIGFLNNTATGSNVVFEIAGPYLLVRGSGHTSASNNPPLQLTSYADIRVWDQTNGWRTVGTDSSVATLSAFGWVRIGTDYYATRKINTSTGMTFTNLDTLVSTNHSLPATAAVLARDQWMWTSDGRVAAASLTPTWTKPYAFSYGVLFSYRCAAIGDSGELRVFKTFTGAGAGIETYLFDPTQGGPWSESGLFSATGLAADGEPQGVAVSQIAAGDGIVGVAGWVRADYVDPTLDNTEYVGAVWVTDGFTGSSIIVLEDTSGYINGTTDSAFAGVAVNGRTVTGIAGGANAGTEFSYVDAFTF